MKKNIQIEYLADYPELLPTLKRWFEEEWKTYYGPHGLGDAETDLLAYSNQSGLPLGIIAFINNEVCGILALKENSITRHSHLGPWVAAGLVSPAYRGMGIGSTMLRSAEKIARQLGHVSLYCGTHSAKRILERNNWHYIDKSLQNGEEVFIYKKSLNCKNV